MCTKPVRLYVQYIYYKVTFTTMIIWISYMRNLNNKSDKNSFVAEPTFLI